MNHYILPGRGIVWSKTDKILQYTCSCLYSSNVGITGHINKENNIRKYDKCNKELINDQQFSNPEVFSSSTHRPNTINNEYINVNDNNIKNIDTSSLKYSVNKTDDNTGNIVANLELNNKNVDKSIRINQFNIQMISKKLYDQLFDCEDLNLSDNVDSKAIDKYTKDLHKHNLLTSQEEVSDVELNLPKLDGNNIIEHFYNIGEKQSGPYKSLLKHLISNVPEKPKNWIFQSGWVRYTSDGNYERVDFPKEDSLILDVEVCISEGDMPTLATAVSNEAWYGWVSPDLINISNKKSAVNRSRSTDRLIPLESNSKTTGYKLTGDLLKPRIVVGHNVSFDRARVKEQYWLERTGLRFFDTMSMHVSVSGITSYQKALLKSNNTSGSDWGNFSALNSLSKVHQLYCGTELSKEKRDTFVKGTLTDVHDQFQELITYCAEDSLATHRILKELLPMFLSRFPHPVTLAGMLELGMAYLPVNHNWLRYIDDANRTYSDLENETKYLLTQRANQACNLLHDDRYKNDLWLWDQDWSVQHLSLKKSALKAKMKKKETVEANESTKQKKKSSEKTTESDLIEEKITVKKKNCTADSEETTQSKKSNKKTKKKISVESDVEIENLPSGINNLGNVKTKSLKTKKKESIADTETMLVNEMQDIVRKSNEFENFSENKTQNYTKTEEIPHENKVENLKSKKKSAKINEEADFDSSKEGFTKNNLLLNEVKNKIISYTDEFDDFLQGECKNLKEKFKTLMSTKEFLPIKSPLLAGYPSWYRKLCVKPNNSIDNWIPGPSLISTGMQISPKLLSLTWKSMPLHYIRGHGWGYLVPYETSILLKEEHLENFPKNNFLNYCLNISSSMLCNCEINNFDEDCNDSVKKVDTLQLHENVQTDLVKFLACSKKFKYKKKKKNDVDCSTNNDVFCKAKFKNLDKIGFIKLLHKNGAHLNVGNPLAKDFIFKFSENELGSSDQHARRIINISRMLSYWRNHSSRIEEQIVVWLGNKDVALSIRSKGIGAILPQVIVTGTLTRRAVERTWMTASNAVDERVGSELRAMVQAPPGYSIVGADVDAQELWIASIIGDANAIKQHGATPFGWMTLSGQKSNGTDMHSVTAKAVNITRTHAKIINYARIYGAGQQFAERLLKQFNPDMSLQEAKDKARKMFSMTKGMRIYKLKDEFLPDVQERMYTRFTAKELCVLHNKSVDEMFHEPKWSGGSESAMFNRLEEIACSKEPKTPFLDGRLSRALEPHRDIEDRFIPTRVNWVVQSGAVDFLHLMLVNMRWLLGRESRFCLSFHDEVRYLVKDNIKYQTALALHVTNLMVRAFCVQRLGMTDLPRSVAFFSSVEVDSVLRKEADNDCITPSNPYGLSKAYGISLGETLDIDKAIEKAGNVIGIHKLSKSQKKTNVGDKQKKNDISK